MKFKFHHYVSDYGLGMPYWTTYPGMREQAKHFQEVQLSIKGKIESARDYLITYGDLGAKEFKNHWFEPKPSKAGDE